MDMMRQKRSEGKQKGKEKKETWGGGGEEGRCLSEVQVKVTQD
jgi:hypothetical protein